MLHPGLYEQVINNALTRELAEIPEARKAVAPIDKAEASKVLAQYLADVIQKGLDNVLDNGGDISAQIELSNRIVNLIQSTTKEPDFAALGVDERAEQLFALLRKADPRLAVGKTAADIERPETSIAQSSLFTGAVLNLRCSRSSKKKLSRPTELTCWYPLSSGAACGSSWTNCGNLRKTAASSVLLPRLIWVRRMLKPSKSFAGCTMRK